MKFEVTNNVEGSEYLVKNITEAINKHNPKLSYLSVVRDMKLSKYVRFDYSVLLGKAGEFKRFSFNWNESEEETKYSLFFDDNDKCISVEWYDNFGTQDWVVQNPSSLEHAVQEIVEHRWG